MATKTAGFSMADARLDREKRQRAEDRMQGDASKYSAILRKDGRFLLVKSNREFWHLQRVMEQIQRTVCRDLERTALPNGDIMYAVARKVG